MNPKTISVFRWIVILPASFIMVMLGTLLLHLILYFTLRDFVEPNPELPERLLVPVVSPFAFVVAAYFISPNKKLPAVLVACMIVFMLVVISWSGGEFLGNALILRFKGYLPAVACH